MEIHYNPNHEEVKKPDIESVEKEQDSYRLLGKYLRKKGLNLYEYNPTTDTISRVKTKDITEGKLQFVDGKTTFEPTSKQEAKVDARYIHFEALNDKTAKKRVAKYKSGNIKDLCNLKQPDLYGFKLY